jgi:hypothetical protein
MIVKLAEDSLLVEEVKEEELRQVERQRKEAREEAEKKGVEYVDSSINEKIFFLFFFFIFLFFFLFFFFFPDIDFTSAISNIDINITQISRLLIPRLTQLGLYLLSSEARMLQGKGEEEEEEKEEKSPRFILSYDDWIGTKPSMKVASKLTASMFVDMSFAALKAVTTLCKNSKVAGLEEV